MQQAKLYNFLVNPKGEVCMVFKPSSPYSSNPKNPEIIYDGKDHALLYRDNDNLILIDYIPVDFHDTLFNIDKVLIVEYDIIENKISHEYFANVVKVKKMPKLNDNFVSRDCIDKELKSLGLL